LINSKTEEELLKFDSNGMEQYIKELQATRTLSPHEEKEVKRVRRLIKNREYAQSSRDKRKVYVDELEKQISDINAEKAILQQRVNQLEMENKSLKFHMAKMLRGDPDSLIAIKQKTRSAINSFTKTTATTALFVLVFSFALFSLGSDSYFSSTGIKSANQSPFPDFANTNDVGKISGHQSIPHRRVLLTSEPILPENMPEPTLIHKITPMVIQRFLAKYNLLVLPPETTMADSLSSKDSFSEEPLTSEALKPFDLASNTLEKQCNSEDKQTETITNDTESKTQA